MPFSSFAAKTQMCGLSKMRSDVVHTTEQPPSAPAFTYDRLEDASREIRLVEIIEIRDGFLNLKLSVYKKVDAPEYNAISYTWSDGGLPRWVEITVNNQMMNVTENCRYALEQAHSQVHPDQPCQTHFWIDSICIDQGSDLEKQHQVAMMADIYAQAVTVLSCVGCHEDNSEDLVQVLEVAKSFAKERLGNGKFPPGTENGWFTFSDTTAMKVVRSFISTELPMQSSLFERFLHSFFDFSERCYWTRLWIIQEVAASKQLEILCGPDRFPRSAIYLLHWIATCCWFFFKSAPVKEPKKKEFYSENSFKRFHVSEFSFFTFVLGRNLKDKIPAQDIFSFRNKFKCSRPEDRVYGMLNLVEWPDANPPIKVEPVYQPSATVDLAELFLSLSGELSELEFQKVFEGLEICHQLDEVERLVRERSGDSSASQRRRGKYPAQSWSGAIRRCEVLSRSDTEGMTKGLATELDHIGPAAGKFHPIPNSTHDAVQLLYSGSKVAGLLCNSARENDLIIRVPFGKVLLVLRSTKISHNSKIEYDIIGQGLLFEGFDFFKRPPPPSATGKKHAEARLYSHIRHRLTWVGPSTGGLKAYAEDFELCRPSFENLYRMASKEIKCEDGPGLTVEMMFRSRTKDCIHHILTGAGPWTLNFRAHKEDLELCCQYLEVLYHEGFERVFLEEELFPTILPTVTSMTQMLVEGNGMYDVRVHAEETLRNALLYINCVLESVNEFHDLGRGWNEDFFLEVEPLEMLLFACQDLEKDGTRNEGKTMQRLTTNVHGIVIGVPTYF